MFFAPRLSHTLKHTVHTIALWAKVKTCDRVFGLVCAGAESGQDECDPVKKELKMGIIELAIQEITTFSFFKKTQQQLFNNFNNLISFVLLCSPGQRGSVFPSTALKIM